MTPAFLLSLLFATPLAADQRDLVHGQLERSRARYTTTEGWDARRQELRNGFLIGAGLWPLPARSPLKVTVTNRRVYDGYSVENVALETLPGFFCTGNLYRPLAQEKPGPGILCPHGHFRPDGRFRPEHQVRCAHFARMGATVFSYGMVGWQDSQQTTHDDPNVLALQTWNSLRALDYLCGLKEVDPARIGVTGASGGGTQTFFLALLDDRVKVSAPVVIVYPWAAPAGCRCEGGLPVMQSTQTNAIELAAAVAPRPQLLISVGGDETRDFPEVGFPFIRAVYQIYRRGDAVQNVHLPDEAHDFGPSKRKAVYAFFAKHLGLPRLDEDLTRITVERPEQLAVFDKSHPLPPHAVHGQEATGRALAALPRSNGGQARPPEGEGYFFTPAGFDREGRHATAGRSFAWLNITVKDAGTGRPTPCRINVVGADGNYHWPKTDYLTPYALGDHWPAPGAWGNRVGKAPYRYLGHFFYSWGTASVVVPAGAVRVEVWKGLEYRPQVVRLDAPVGKSTACEVILERTAAMAAFGYHSGDPHLHFPRQNARDEQVIFDLLAAEDIHFGAVLGYNDPPGPYAGFAEALTAPQWRRLGVRSARTQNGISILSGQEYRSSTYGHLNLYLRNDLVFEGQVRDANDGPAYGEVARETLDRGGFAIHAHGGYGQEIYADAAQGAVDAVELLQFGVYRGIGLENWYHMLNTGYRFPCVGASDYPACRFLGDCRTYVRTAGSQPTFLDWLRGVAAGRSFVTTGTLLLLDVDSQRPGDILARPAGGRRSVTVHVRVRSEVTDVPQVQIIVNGRVAATARWTLADRRADGWYATRETLELNESSWIAARAFTTTPGGQPDGEAHTNPVYVYFGGKAPYRQESLDAWVERIDRQIALHTKRSFSGKARVLAYFQRSRDLLLHIREMGGLSADADPVQMARKLETASQRASRLLEDGSLRNPTDAELKEFLKPLPPKSPVETLKTFETIPGFELQPVAAEPLVYNPVAAAFDADGNLYVAELRDYPYKPGPGKKPLGRIRLLKDTKGIGVFDQATVFADDLLWPAGIAPWKGGVFVTAPPDVWYFKDTKGTGVADLRRKVYTGFGTENPQALVNNLQWGLDHKIYGATAGNGGNIRPVERTDVPPVSVNGHDFRFDPATGAFESIIGTIQFGNTFDDWGNRFVCNESNPLYHVVLPEHYLARNPYLPVPSAIHNLAAAPVPIYRISPVERWRHIRSSRRIAQNERPAQNPGVNHNVVDAGAGVTIYRGGAYPPQFYGNAFTGDPQNNLVHRRILIPDGVTFQSRRADEKTEFVRSSDNWFRPVNFVNAPDGTLYCLDLSREILEAIHIPLDVVKHLDLTSGRNSGRIYRLAPAGFRSPPPPRLSRATTAELVAALESPHGWWRDTAHRLLFQRQDSSAVVPLRRMAAEGKRPQARLLALWSLQGLGALPEDVVLQALADPHPAVREHAVRLAEPRLGSAAALRDGVLRLADDPDARVCFQVAFTLGEMRDPRAVAALARLARRHADDLWMRTAVLSSVAQEPAQMLTELLGDSAFATAAAGGAMLEPLALVVGIRNRKDELRVALDTIAQSPATRNNIGLCDQLILAVGTGLKRAGARFPGVSRHDPQPSPGEQMVGQLLQAAATAAGNDRISAAERRRAIELLGCAPFSQTREILARRLEPVEPPVVQVAAVRALAGYAEPEVAEVLLAGWSHFTPDLRTEVLQALLGREERTLAFLTAVGQGRASAAQVDLSRRELLLKHRNATIREKAARIFGSRAPNPRAAVLADYKAALRLAGDAHRGELVFEKNCTACHQLGTKGNAVGPNLASSPARDPESLLVNILDPNQYVPPNYMQYLVVDKKGRVFTGLIASRTATSITLRRDRGETETVLRSDVEEFTSTGKSLMPEGLEQNITKQEMADLLAFLREALVKYGDSTDANRERDFGTVPAHLVEPAKKN